MISNSVRHTKAFCAVRTWSSPEYTYVANVMRATFEGEDYCNNKLNKCTTSLGYRSIQVDAEKKYFLLRSLPSSIFTINGAQDQMNEVPAFKYACSLSTCTSLSRIFSTCDSKLGSQAYNFRTFKENRSKT